MRPTCTVLAVILLAGLLAGCVAPPDAAADDAAPPVPVAGIPRLPDGSLPAWTMDWSLLDCTFVAILAPVPAATVQPHLPEGFRSLSLGETAFGAPNPTADGNFGLELFSCARGTTHNGTVEGMTYASYFSAVAPPAEYAREVDTHFVKWDVLIPDGPRREMLAAYGVPAVKGEVRVDFFDSKGEDEATVRGSFSLADGPAHALDGVAFADFADGSFTEFTHTPGGLVEWTQRYFFDAGGVGSATVNVAPGTFAAEILGAGPASGVGIVGAVRFDGGSIALPPQPAP